MANDKQSIRFATPADAEEILAIYAPYVENTAVSFEEVVPTLSEFKKRIETIQEKYPYLVAQDAAGKIMGYAYAHEFRERAAFQWGSELSVYLTDEAKGKGLGTALYTALIEILKLQGIKEAYGLVTYPNKASDALHTGLGFERMMLQKNAGYKNGSWQDMSWYVKYLDEFEGEPAKPTWIGELLEKQGDAVKKILR